MAFDRYWLLTWTTYGQWLPGDPRGSVTRTRDPGHATRQEHDHLQTPVIPHLAGLHASARQSLKCPPVRLTLEHAQVLMAQFEQTATFRNWGLVAVAIMANHVHIVVGVEGDPEPETILRDFKSYGSRALNQRFQTPGSGTWWTESGSRRKLADEAAKHFATAYVRSQEFPLIIHIPNGERE